MRTTVTLDDDVVAALRAAERERGISFEEALNSAVRAGLPRGSSCTPGPFEVDVFSAEIQPGIDLRRANRLVADLPCSDSSGDDDSRRFPGVTWLDPLDDR